MDDLFESVVEGDETITASESEDLIIEQQFESGVNQSLGIEHDAQRESDVKALFAGMTEEELKDIVSKARQVDELSERLKKTHDGAFGRIGMLEQNLKELSQSRAQQQSVPVSKDSFKALAEYLGDEEMVEALAKDLESLQIGGNSGFDSASLLDSINEQVNSKVDEISKSFETKLLTLQHPDWAVIKDTDEFAEWQATLTADAVSTLFESNDGMVLAGAFTKFKAWQGKKSEFAEKKKQRLEDAVLPKGGYGRSQTTADDAFNQGLKKVLGNR